MTDIGIIGAGRLGQVDEHIAENVAAVHECGNSHKRLGQEPWQGGST